MNRDAPRPSGLLRVRPFRPTPALCTQKICKMKFFDRK
nr:MAG TPA: hypothetical protein [Caudoviricetes sp.]